ncbi:GNAT family N-acetyltransferase [Curvibacter sp. RS43]|uniref:GNAT family N-acetyltransferase n=1 Tax=Curvibacter microcysteis TaxID=3026419 RepID=UPI00235DE488|nr:GNAT family N-acetyltransferase [Curvibacter sp. RS43]MDD0812237.1 GNAT family N-acetyltransferase [Curvibacter sp. RS43]
MSPLHTPDSALRLRPATAEDCDTLLRLIRGLAEYEHLLDRVTATPEQLRATLFGERPAAEALLAEWQGEPAGFALFFPNYSTFLAQPGLYLEDLFVLPERRGLGIGKALLQALAALAVQRGCGRFEWSVLDWNQPAIDFYQAMGATVMPDWRICRVTGEALQRLGTAG